MCEAGRCEVWSRERLRAWAFAALPELASLPKPPSLADVPWLDGAAKATLWVDAAELWSQGAPKGCVPIAFTKHEGSLFANLPVKFGENPKANGVWSYTLQLGAGASLLGPGWHTKTKDGGAAGGIGEYRRLGHHLIAPLEDALRYRGAHVGKRVVCDDRDLEPDPRCPRCVRCVRYEARNVSLAPHVGFGYGKKKPTAAEVDASQPPVCIGCPSDERRDRLARFELGLAGVDTVVPLASGPAFFRAAKACSADREARLAAGWDP